jgi:hypothetical protein
MASKSLGTVVLPFVFFAMLAGCRHGDTRLRDTTITRGADGAAEWSRHLASAVPIGIPADSAGAILKRNGFSCQRGADSLAYLYCDKQSGGFLDLVSRRWHAALNVDARGRVIAVRGSTYMVGP